MTSTHTPGYKFPHLFAFGRSDKVRFLSWFWIHVEVSQYEANNCLNKNFNDTGANKSRFYRSISTCNICMWYDLIVLTILLTMKHDLSQLNVFRTRTTTGYRKYVWSRWTWMIDLYTKKLHRLTKQFNLDFLGFGPVDYNLLRYDLLRNSNNVVSYNFRAEIIILIATILPFAII